MEPRRAGRPADYSGLDPETVRSLEFLGLSAYEIKVYLAVLEHPRTRVPDIARLAKVPQPKVYSTVKRLIGRGLIESELGPVNRYIALDPKHGFGSLIAEVGQREDNARAIVSALSARHRSGSAEAGASEGRVKLFQSRPAAARSFRDRLTRVRRELTMIVRWPLEMPDYSADIGTVRANGAKVRMLCEVLGELNDEHREFVDRMTEAGALVRGTVEAPVRLALFDDEAVALPMFDPAPHEGDGFMMLEVRNPDLSRGFRALFEALWAKGTDL